MKNNKIRFVILAACFSVFINLFYSNSVVLADEITTEYPGGQAEEKYNKEKNMKKGVRAMEVNDRATLQNTVEDMGLFDSGVENVFTVSNYDDYYDFQENYLKNAVNKDYWLSNGDADFGSNVETNVLTDIQAGNHGSLNDIEDTYFSDDDNLHLMARAWWRSNGLKYLYNMGLSNGNDYALIDNTIYSHNPFDVDVTIFEDKSTQNGPNYAYFNYQPDNWVAQLDNTTGLYKCVLNQCMFFYSDIPIYATYKDIAGTEDNYLGQAPYNYQNSDNIYNAIGNDQTGFVVDRRLVREHQGGIDDNLGVMENSFHMRFGGASVDDMYLFTSYELNKYSKERQQFLYLYYDYNFKMSGNFLGQGLTISAGYLNSTGYLDQYSLNNSNYLLIDMDQVLQRIVIDDSVVVNAMNTIGTRLPDNGRVWRGVGAKADVKEIINILAGHGINVNTSYNASTADVGFNADLNFLDYDISFGAGGKFWSEWGTYDTIDYMNLEVTCYLYDDQTKKSSTVCIKDFDLKNNTVTTEGGFEKNGENVPQWNGNYTNGNQGGQESSGYGNLTNYTNPQNLNNPTAYGGSATGGNANVVVNTGNGQYYVVDIPANDILNKTPNLKTIITDFKDMLSETKEESIIPLITQTYNYIPAPVWNYILYGVGIMLAIGIWRAITRRN